MEESPDSRTAAFDRKRVYDTASLDRLGENSSTASTPRKFKDEGVEIEHSKETVLVSGDSSPKAGGFEHIQYSDSDDVKVSGEVVDGPEFDRLDRPMKDLGTVPSVNWNSGSKANIRTSLGRIGVKTSRQRKMGHRVRLKLVQDQTGTKVKTLTEISAPISPPRSASIQTGSPDYTEDVNIRTPISIEPTGNPPDSKPSAPILASINPSGARPLGTSVEGNSRPVRISLSSEESQESDSGVVLNLQNSGQESGEIPETNTKSSIWGAPAERIINLNHTESDGEINESEDGDAMIEYSQSNRTTNERETENDTISRINAQQPKLPTLADLNPEELKFQLRYFHLAKSLDTVDGNSLVRCLVCAQEGHMSEFCSSLTCGTCGTYKQHFTKNCPQMKRCAKCREHGHQESNCHYKLQRLVQNEMTCDLCQRDGHNEDNCELLWRTSGRPWESDLADRKIRLECYECGRAGHLGNDCSTRRPGKWMGTSTWSLPGGKQSSYESQRGISIKGRAQQKNQPVFDDSDDDRAKFFRPKIPEPVHKGQIRIATQNIGGNRQGAVMNKSGGGDWQGLQGRGFSRPEDRGQYSYRPSDRRSISPHYPARGFNSNVDSYRPPVYSSRLGKNIRHQDKNHYGGNQPYRPMPSAAQNAWSRHKM